MKQEYLDIVDENNNPTGQKKLRSEAHSNGLWHKTVHIYFFRIKNNNFEILVHLRSKTKDLHPNCWDTRFGGHLKSGESLEEAVLGEIKEEVGLKVNLEDLIKGEMVKIEHYPNNEFTHIYFYNFDRDTNELRFEDDEVQEVKWMSTADILEDISKNPNSWTAGAENFKKAIKDLEQKFPLN